VCVSVNGHSSCFISSEVGCSYGLCSVGCGIVQLEVKERNGELKNQCKNNCPMTTHYFNGKCLQHIHSPNFATSIITNIFAETCKKVSLRIYSMTVFMVVFIYSLYG
jgi:hypothetical protein